MKCLYYVHHNAHPTSITSDTRYSRSTSRVLTMLFDLVSDVIFQQFCFVQGLASGAGSRCGAKLTQLMSTAELCQSFAICLTSCTCLTLGNWSISVENDKPAKFRSCIYGREPAHVWRPHKLKLAENKAQSAANMALKFLQSFVFS